jgi:dTDP-4-amino-4,6-dideoxygalactose transaminase
MKIPFLDLNGQNNEIREEIDLSLGKAIKNCDFILGKQEVSFEQEFAGYCGARFGIGVNSGTDALFLALLSLGVGPQDEVIVPVFTYIATAFAVTFTGAKPVFVDIEENTYNIDVHKIEEAITKKTKAIIPVHLFGQPADMQPILKIARKYNLKIIEDAAQAHGAKYKISENNWKRAGNIADIGCFSFYPTKNLGAFGDGGMIICDDRKIFKKLFMLRDYGRKSRYEHVTLGYNSRLDTLQAAILLVKLKYLEKWNMLRRKNAKVYNRLFKNNPKIICPYEADYAKSVYHAYSIRVKNRDKMREHLRKKNIGTMIYYPLPLHLQEVYKSLGGKKGDFPVAEEVAREIISLPLYPHLKEAQIKFIANTLIGCC